MTWARTGSVFIVVFVVIITLTALAVLGDSGGVGTRVRAGDNAASYVYLDASVVEQDILPFGTVEYEIIVRNLGDSNITYTPPSPVSLTLPTDWSISFSPGSAIFIPGNMFEILIVNLTASSEAKANTIVDLEIIGTTSNPEAEIIPVTLTTSVRQIYATGLSTVDRLVLDSPLDTKNFDITIDNNGNGDDRVRLEITGIPSGLELSQNSQEFIINHGDSASLTITMYPSSILTAGEYKIGISLYRINDTGKTMVSSQDLWVEVRYYPDLTLSMGDIVLSKYVPYSGENVTVNITVHNIGDSDARNFSVSIFPVTRSGSQLQDIHDISIEFLGMNRSTTISIPWRADPPAVNKLQVILDPQDTIGELDEENNKAELHITIITESNPSSGDPNVGKYTIAQMAALGIVAILTGITIATGGFILTTDWGKFAMFKLLGPFYTRVKKDEVLNHEVRELVYDYVINHPGEHFRAILTKLELTNGTLVHHLKTLERQEFIKSERDGPFKRFYPTGRQFTEEVLEINGIQKKILDAVASNPGVTQKGLSNLLHTSQPTINYHVKALRGVRLLNIKRDGKNTRCFPGHSLNGWYRGGVS